MHFYDIKINFTGDGPETYFSSVTLQNTILYKN
jgi:hypothetical protein